MFFVRDFTTLTRNIFNTKGSISYNIPIQRHDIYDT